MNTKIYKSYSDFLVREDRKINGVSVEFSKENPNFEIDNKTNEGCWNCSDCSDCSYCSYCSDSSDCSNCHSCSDCSVKENKIEVPKIKNIHQKVYDAASTKSSLDMGEWHTCETTHCRAGWVVFLAGEAGRELENHIGTPLAAAKTMRIALKLKWHGH